jgi:aryl-alcohol dehydrogenase-like predicted oxidoreductase
MDYRQLGNSGLKVSVLRFGTATFGGGSEFFRAWGQSTVNEAKQLIDVCLEAGINLFDTADVYSLPLIFPSNGLTPIDDIAALIWTAHGGLENRPTSAMS